MMVVAVTGPLIMLQQYFIPDTIGYKFDLLI
jgi:hypothetical protein